MTQHKVPVKVVGRKMQSYLFDLGAGRSFLIQVPTMHTPDSLELMRLSVVMKGIILEYNWIHEKAAMTLFDFMINNQKNLTLDNIKQIYKKYVYKTITEMYGEMFNNALQKNNIKIPSQLSQIIVDFISPATIEQLVTVLFFLYLFFLCT